MTIKELKNELENYNETLEVRLAEQPNYPSGYTIDTVKEIENDEGKVIVYILEGDQKERLPKELFE